MANETKYSIGDQVSLTDLNGKVYRVHIQSIATYSVAKQLASLEILAQQYPTPYDTLDGTELFYICSNVEGDAEFDNLILWDNILNHTKTVYITKPSIFKLTILPIPVSSGKSVRSIDEIVIDIKSAIKNAVPDCSIAYEDVTDTEDDELANLKTQVGLCKTLVSDVLELSTVRPLVAQLSSLDIEQLTTGIQSLLTDIQAQLATMVGENES